MALELGGELWNARMGADDVVFGICLSAVERAKGRRSTNAIVVMCMRIDVGGGEN